TLGLRASDGLMAFAPPEHDDRDAEEDDGKGNPSRGGMDDIDDAEKLIADEIADGDDYEAPYDCAGDVPSEEAPERHPRRSRHRSRHEAHAGDKPSHEDGFAAVGLKESLEAVVALAGEGEASRQARHQPLSSCSAEHVPAAIAGYGACHRNDVNPSDVEDFAAGEESGGQH